jgi:signal transduction histidine kinase
MDRGTEIERLVRERESLHEVIEAMGSERDLGALLGRIVRQACSLLDAAHGVIGLYRADGRGVETVAGHGLPPGRLGSRIPPGEGVAAEVLRTGRAVVLDRYGTLDHPVWPELSEDAVLGVPVSLHGRVIAYFGVGSPPPRRFGAADLATLAVFSRHAAIAIDNARRHEREQRRNERLELLARIGRIIAANLALEELLQRAADAIHDLLGYPAIAIPLLEPGDPPALVVRTTGGGYRDLIPREYRLPVTEGIMGAAARERRVQLVNDVDADPRHHPTPGAAGVRAELAVPILLGEAVLGVLNVESAEPFTEDDAAGLQTVADHLAVAIANARLYEAEQRRAKRLALIAGIAQTITAGLDLDELLQTSADLIHELLGYPNVDIPLVDPADPEVLVVRARGGLYKRVISGEDRLPVREGIMGAAVRERRLQLVNDVARDPRYVRPSPTVENRAELAVPILLGPDVLGVLNVESAEPFDDDDAAGLKVVADHLAVAIRNARLYERAQALAVLEERQRLSRDLHDSVTQLLFSITLIAQSVGPAWRRDSAEGERQVGRLLDLARSALAEMRALVDKLRPAEPEREETAGVGMSRVRDLGLAAALARYGAEISGDALRVRVDAGGYAPQPLEREEVLYRIAQEALNNIVKHSGSSEAAVLLGAEEGQVVLRVTDAGCGFHADRVLAAAGTRGSGGFGLVGMRERVEALRGVLHIRSRPGSGTSVDVRLPLRDP